MSEIGLGLAATLFSDRTSVLDRKGQFARSLTSSLKSLSDRADLDRGKKEAIRAARVITRRDYPALATLKLAGRRTEEIAERYGMSPERILPYITRAINAYRKGKLKLDAGEVRNEAAAKGEEEGTKVANKIAGAVEQSTVANNAFAQALGAPATGAAAAEPSTAGPIPAAPAAVDIVA